MTVIFLCSSLHSNKLVPSDTPKNRLILLKIECRVLRTKPFLCKVTETCLMAENRISLLSDDSVLKYKSRFYIETHSSAPSLDFDLLLPPDGK